MSIIKVLTRGNSIQWAATFEDFNGAVVVPETATVSVVYAGGQEGPITMIANTAGEWVAEWDSSVADTGKVYWSIRTTGPSIARDGQIILSANVANPSP